MALNAKEKKELVKTQLKQLRKDLRIMHSAVTEEQTMPDPTQVKTFMGQLESLLEVLDPKSARKSKS